jgi:hypothetical protein
LYKKDSSPFLAASFTRTSPRKIRQVQDPKFWEPGMQSIRRPSFDLTCSKMDMKLLAQERVEQNGASCRYHSSLYWHFLPNQKVL